MIFPAADILLCEAKNGNLCFHSKDVDLDKDSLFVPIECEGGLGTMEFKRNVAIMHPPNGKDKRITAVQFKEFVEKDFEELDL